MVQIWVSSSLDIQEIVINVFETVVCDCIDSDFSSSLPALRKQDILGSLKPSLSPLLETAYNFLGQCIAQYRVSGNARLGEAVNSILRMVNPIVKFAKAGEVCQAPHDFAVVCVDLLQFPDIQADAANFLLAITHAKLPEELFARLLQKIPQCPLPIVTDEEPTCESFLLQCTYAEAAFSLLSENISAVVSDSFLAIPTAHNVLHSYVTLLAGLLRLPSKRLVSDVLMDWVKVGRYLAL